MCEEQKQAIKFSCEGNSTKIHNSFVLFFLCFFGKTYAYNPLYSAFIPNFHELLHARVNFSLFPIFRPRNDQVLWFIFLFLL